jgi:hypothetical protein
LVERYKTKTSYSPVKGETTRYFALNRASFKVIAENFYQYYAPNGAATWNHN